MSKSNVNGTSEQDKPLIAIDFDGVICDTGAYKICRARELGITKSLHRDLTNKTACERYFGEDVYRALSDGAYAERTTLSLPPVKGALMAICELSKIVHVYVFTSRSGRWVKPCETWLSKHGLVNLVKEVVSCPGDGQKLLEAKRKGILALLDDDERHLQGHGHLEVLRFLFRHRPNCQRKDIVEANWSGFVDSIKGLAGSRDRRE
jgi:hypothetical protein